MKDEKFIKSSEQISVSEQQQYLDTHSIEEFGQWLREKVYSI